MKNSHLVTFFGGENVTRNHRLLVTSNQGRKRSGWITWWVDVKCLTGCQKQRQAVFISFLCILLLWWEGQCNLHVGFLLLKGGDSSNLRYRDWLWLESQWWQVALICIQTCLIWLEDLEPQIDTGIWIHILCTCFFFACGTGPRQSHGFWVIVSWRNCSVWSVLQKNTYEDYRILSLGIAHLSCVVSKTEHPTPGPVFWLHNVPIRVTIAQVQVAKCVRWNPIHPHHENLETSEFTSLWPTWREFLQWLERGNVKQITISWFEKVLNDHC